MALNINNNNISSETLEFISTSYIFYNLQILQLENTQVCDIGIQKLQKNIKYLKKINLN